MKNVFIPRVPTATAYNKEDFVCAWIYAYGGTLRNAIRAWEVSKRETESRDLSKLMHGV